MEGKIGVIDSGVGGLTVAKELMKYLPNEEIVYFGDTERCPYGNRPKEEIVLFSWQMIDYIMKYQLKALVIACNTATAFVLEEARTKLDIPVFGVIEPGSKEALRASSSKKIGVIGTTRTIESKSYTKTILGMEEDAEVFELDCPKFVPMIEANNSSKEEVFEVVKNTLLPLFDKKVDTLILGCTHYPLIESTIAKVMGENVSLVHSGKEIAKELKNVIPLRDISEKPNHLFFASGEPRHFEKLASEWLHSDVTVKKVNFDSVIAK